MNVYVKKYINKQLNKENSSDIKRMIRRGHVLVNLVK